MAQVPNWIFGGLESWPCGFESKPDVTRFRWRRSPCYPIENFKLWPVKLAHRARMKVKECTFFCISLHLDSQYLCLWVYKSRHCMSCKPPLCVYKIQAECVYRIGREWTKKEKKRNWAKKFLATFWNMAVLVPQMVKNLPEMAGDPGSILGLGSSPGEGNGNPLQYSCPENPMDRGSWRATFHGATMTQT